jgi:hypothetical protein
MKMAAGNPPYTKQHTTARAYLKSWATPPERQKCWVFPMTAQCECGPAALKPLKCIMWEPDIYTLYTADGSRNVHYEAEIFGRAEGHYADLKQFFGKPAELLKPSNRRRLARFTAFQIMKTPAMFAAYISQLQQAVALCDAGLDPSMTFIEIINKQGVKVQQTVEQVRGLWEKPFENFIMPRLESRVTILKRMKLKLVTFSDPNALLTSDTPAIIRAPYDGAYFGYLNEPEAQVSMPLSPSLLGVFNWQADGVENGNALTAMKANILRVRNARSMLASASDSIDPAIFEAAKQAPEASEAKGFRGHLDPIPENVREQSPLRFEMGGPNIPPVPGLLFPDGRIVHAPLPQPNSQSEDN